MTGAVQIIRKYTLRVRCPTFDQAADAAERFRATRSINDLISALFGPAAEEAGQMLRDEVRSYRRLRRARLWARTQSALRKLGVSPKPVPSKLLSPIIDNASLEDDDDLQDIWANLLANAADPRERNKIHPSFPAILKELTAQDVKFLDALYNAALELGKGTHYTLSLDRVPIDPRSLQAIYSAAGLANARPPQDEWLEMTQQSDLNDFREMQVSMNTFEREGIIAKVYEMPIRDGNTNTYALGMAYSFTSLGASFVAACQAPKANL
jgi:Abortive infection alpha